MASPLPWIDYTDRMVGENHPTRADTLNTPLKEFISRCGGNPDTDFTGFVGPVVNVMAYGAVGDGSTDDTAAIQAAINTGKDVFFPKPPVSYQANNLTQSTTYQRLFGVNGSVLIFKNANGPLLTCSGLGVSLKLLNFRDPGPFGTPTYTGDGLVLTGETPTIDLCGSRNMAGRALKATGNHVTINNTCDIYATGDGTASGYDIEIGVSGTNTGYHQIIGVYSSQNVGGLKFVDCGSQVILGGQFGKLTIAKGTGPAGSNGGMVMGARILGPIEVELSNARFCGCQLGASATLHFATGTGYCTFGLDNLWGGAAITNDGSDANVIFRQGVGNAQEIWLGDDSSLAKIQWSSSNGAFRVYERMEVRNNKNAAFRNAADSADAGTIAATTGNNFGVNALIAALQFAAVSGFNFTVGANTILTMVGTGSPEGVVTAGVGSTFHRTDGGAATSFYVKESGTGNTGWVGK